MCVSLYVRRYVTYCLAHDNWLIIKLCMFVGYHDANNVSNLGGDRIKFKKTFYSIIYAVTVSAVVAT